MLLAAPSRTYIIGVQKFAMELAPFGLSKERRERRENERGIVAHQHNTLNI